MEDQFLDREELLDLNLKREIILKLRAEAKNIELSVAIVGLQAKIREYELAAEKERKLKDINSYKAKYDRAIRDIEEKYSISFNEYSYDDETGQLNLLGEI